MEVAEGTGHVLSGQALSVLDPNTTVIDITINKNHLATSTTAANGVVYSGIVDSYNVVIIRKIVAGTSIIQISAPMLINDYLDITLNVSCTGYSTYNNTIRVYGYDVSNYTSNQYENIVLIKNTLIGSYSSFLYLCDPNTNINYYYSLNSCKGIAAWYENSVQLGATTNYISSTLLPVTNTVTTYNRDANGNYILSSTVNSASTSFTPFSIKLYPEYNAYVNTNNALFDKSQVLTYLVDVRNVTKFMIDSAVSMPYQTLTIGVEVYDYFLQQVDYSFVKDITSITDSVYTRQYNLNLLSCATRYRIKYSMWINARTSTNKVLDLVANQAIVIRNIGLNNFRILNNTAVNQVVSIQEIQDDVFVETLNSILLPNNVLNITMPDGFHKAVINGVTYPFVAYENTANIISTAIENIVDKAKHRKCDCEKHSCQCEPFTAHSRLFFLTNVFQVTLKKFFASDLSYSDFRPEFEVSLNQWNNVILSILKLGK